MQKYTKVFCSAYYAEEEFKRSCWIYERCKNAKHFVFPKPIKVTDNFLEYQYISGKSLYDIKNRYLIKNLNNSQDIFKIVGKSLAEFHKLLNDDYSIKHSIHIHGDFFPRNIIVTDSKIGIFDANSPKGLNLPLIDMAYRDVATFIMGMKYKYPLGKIYLRYRKNNNVLVRKFISGYIIESGAKFDINCFKWYLENSLKEEMAILKHTNNKAYCLWKVIFSLDLTKIHNNINFQNIFGYSFSHLGDNYGEKYEKLYAKGSIEYFIREKEEKAILQILFDKDIKSCLDFACGTGLITKLLTEIVSQVIAVDVSSEMISVAKKKGIKAKFILGDAVNDRSLITEQFDLITCFRFFLNAEHELRISVMQLFYEKLDKEGILIINNHGNKYSMRLFVNLYHYLKTGVYRRELSSAEIYKLAKSSGFRVQDKIFINFLPKIFLNHKIFKRIDEMLVKMPIVRNYSINIIYLLKKNKDHHILLKLYS